MMLVKKSRIFFFTLFCFLFFVPLTWADFGNWFIANKRLSTPLDSSDKKISYRFTCLEDMNLSLAAVYCLESSNSPAYLVSIQEDQNGNPSGFPLAFSSYIPRAASWSTIPLNQVALAKGKVYHLVVEQDRMRGGEHPVGIIGPANYASFLTTDVLNHKNPQDGSPDLKSNTLYYEKGQWKELNQEPVYAVYGLGSHFQGNPYDDPGVRPIYGSGDPGDKAHQVLQGQALHFHCGTNATALAVRIKKQGHPASPLQYQVLKNDFMHHRNNLVYSAAFLNPEQVSSNFQWVTIGFDPKAYADFSPECWYFVFQTDSGKASKDSPGCEDCYVISDVGNSGGLPQAANLTFDNGPHLSREVYSTDGGSVANWRDEFERDANVGILAPNCPPAHKREFNTIPTPEPLDNEDNF